MDPQTLSTLEFDSLLELLVRHVQTPLGRKRTNALRPLTDPGGIGLALDLTTECVHFLSTGERFGLSGIEDPEGSFARLQVQATMIEPQQVLLLERLASIGMGLRDVFRNTDYHERYPSLSEIASRIPDLRRMLAEIKGKVLPSGEMDDNASPELHSIRQETQASLGRIHRSLEKVMQQQVRAVQEEFITFRNGRFVIPVRTDSRIHVPGVVHGLSSSGQTTFMEPLSVIELNNELVRLHEREEMEIARILLAITENFRSNLGGLRTIAEVIAELDLIQAKARLAIEFDCVRPQISEEKRFILENARHILLDHALRQSGVHAVPISFALDADRQVMVISGPNAGGKTVVLKTVGLISLMAQMGLHVPATGAVLPVFDQVFADIGDHQSIAANLSTFTAHMRNIAQMATKIVPPALLLLDEVGTGTDPEEGAALAVAIVDYFRCAGATTLASTHYNPLKMWASQTSGVLNASVEFDERTLRPTYRLLLGIPGASSGLEIARRMGVPESLLAQAKSLANPDQIMASDYLKTLKTLVDEQQALRAALEEERAATADRFSRLQEEFSRREAMRQEEFAAALEKAGSEFTKQGEHLIKGIDDRIAAEKMRKLVQSRTSQFRHAGMETTRKIAAEISLGPKSDIASEAARAQAGNAAEQRIAGPIEGDKVWIKPLSQPGIVKSLQGETYSVGVGSLTYRAHIEELQFLEAGPASKDKDAPPRPAPELSLQTQFTPELKIIGMTADEALDRVDRFLDEAFLAGAESVRIIHGHGKGILRRAVTNFLKQHPQVEKFQPAPLNQGGGGVTIADLKK